MKRNDPIHEIHLSYQDVPVGEMLCLFNAHGFMEIAIHGGQASKFAQPRDWMKWCKSIFTNKQFL